jgi:hypothetical protein
VDEKRLAVWLHEISLQPGSDRQSAIAGAAETLARAADVTQVPGYVLLAHGDSHVGAFESIRSEMSRLDPTFGCAIDDLETRLIAAVCVAELILNGGKPGLTTAHAVLSEHWSGRSSAIEELVVLSAEALDTSSADLRARRPISTITLPAATYPAFGTDGQAVVHQEAREIVDSVTTSFNHLNTQLGELSSKMDRRLLASDEELDLLWWAFNGYSESLGKLWTSIRKPALIAIALSLEASELIQFDVEPQNLTALFSRILGERRNNKIKLGDAISACGDAEIFPAAPSNSQLLPILTSLNEYRALDGRTGWRDSVQRWSINPDHESSNIEFASQCVREVLLQRQLT